MRRWFLVAGLALSLAVTFDTEFGLAKANPPGAAPSESFGMNAIDPKVAHTVNQAVAAFHAGRRQHTLALLQSAAKTAPNDWRVHVILGRTMLLMSYPASAEREFRIARQLHGSDRFILPSLFEAMLGRQESQNILDEFPDPGANASGDVAAIVLKGRAEALLQLNRIPDARLAMDHSLLLRRDVLGLLTRAKIASAENDSGLANRLTDEAIRMEPRNGHALSAKLNLLVAAGDDNGVLAMTERILRQWPGDPDARSARIEILVKRNQLGRAQGDLKALQMRAPAQARTRFYTALIKMRLNDFRNAWGIAQGLPPDFIVSRPYYALAVSEMAVANEFGMVGQRFLVDALNVSPNSLELRARLASIRIALMDTDGAMQVLAPVKDSQDVQVLIPLAQTYLQLGKLDDAMTATQTVMRRDPKQALPLLSYAVWAQPNSAAFADAYGCELMAQKNSKMAAEELNRAHGLEPKNGEITFHLVQALHASGDARKAAQLLKSLLGSGTQFPDLPAAQQLANAWHV